MKHWKLKQNSLLNREKISYVFIFLMGLFCLFGSSITLAESDENTTIDYSIQKIKPETPEVSDTSSFYDLSVAPGDEVEIQAKIQNSSAQDITINSEILTTYTNRNGQISYTSKAKKYDKSMKYKIGDFSKVVASDAKKKVPAHSEEIVTTNIKVPKEIEEGVYLGSWYFEKDGEEQGPKSDSKDKGLSINNKYSYALAVKLTVGSEIKAPHLDLVSVDTGTHNYKKAINGKIQNDQPAIVSKLKIKADVMKKGKYDVLYTNEMKDVIMAPNSNFDFPVYLKKEQMRPGEYTMRVKAVTNDSKWQEKTWEWSKDFIITKADADQANKEAINDPEPPINWGLYVIVGLLILIVLLLTVYILRQRKIKQQQNSSDKE